MRSRAPLFVAWTLAFLLAAAGAAQPPGAGSPPGTPTVLTVHSTIPALVYAGFAGFGLFRSSDGGVTWESFAAGLPGTDIAGLAVDPFHPGVLYVLVAGHGLLKSQDGGLSWRTAGAGLPLETRAVVADPDEPFTLYAAARPGVFRSTDGAESFEHLFQSPADPVQVLFHPRDVVPLYAAADNALFVSVDFGYSWLQLGQMAATARSVAIDPWNPEVLYAATAADVLASVDGGRSWGSTDLGLAVWQLAFDAGGGLLAATDRGIFRLAALGRSPWQRTVAGPTRALAVDPFDPAALFVADGDAQVLVTRDGGLTFERSLRAAVPPPASLGRQPPPAETPPPLRLRLAEAARPDDPVAALAVHPDDPEVVWAGSRRGVFLGLGHGRTWQSASAGLELLDVHALAVDPENPATLYAGTHGAGLFRSGDFGRTWRPARHGLDLAAVAAVTVDPLEPSVVYAAGRAGLYTSRDHGSSWALLDAGEDLRALEYLAADPLELAAGTGAGRVLGWSVTVDAGRPSSALIGLPPQRVDDGHEAYAVDPERLEIRDLAVDPADASRLYAATVYGLWASADAGRTWQPYRLGPNATAVAVDPRDPAVLWLGTTEGLFRHAGGRWSRIKIPGVTRQATVYSLAAAAEPPETVIYAGLDDGTVAASRDSGVTWSARRLRERPLPPASLGIARSRQVPGDAALAGRLRVFFEETPESWPRRRALLATEWAARARGGEDGKAVAELERLLDEILALQREWGEEHVHDLRFSADSRWLLADHRFDDGARGHSELRLYDLDGLRLRPDGPVSYGEKLLSSSPPPWRALADAAREPEHLHPAWVIADPGIALDWSPRGRFLATRADADRISVWRIAAPRRPEASRFEPRTPAVPGEQWFRLAAPGLDVLAWSAGDRHLAVAGPRGFERPEPEDEESERGPSIVHLVDLERPKVGELEPLRVGFDACVLALRFTAEGRWLWIRGPAAEDADWALLVPRAGRWALVFERQGGVWRVAPQTRLREAFVDAPAAFAELAASPDGRWLAGRPAADDGTAAEEVLLWPLGAHGPRGAPFVLAAAAGEGGPRFSADSRCLALERGRRWLRDLSDDECQRRTPVQAGHGGLVQPLDATPAAERPAHADETGVVVLDGWGCRGCKGAPLKVWRRGGPGWETVGLPAPRRGIERMSPDHRRVVTAEILKDDRLSWRRTLSPVLEVWDVTTPRPAGLRVRSGRFGARELHRDEAVPELAGRELVYWDRPPERASRGTELRDRACQILGRHLTEREWRRYAGDAPHEPVCVFERKPLADGG